LPCDEDFEDAVDVSQKFNKQAQSEDIDQQNCSMLEHCERDMRVIKNSYDTDIPQVICQKFDCIIESDKIVLLICISLH